MPPMRLCGSLFGGGCEKTAEVLMSSSAMGGMTSGTRRYDTNDRTSPEASCDSLRTISRMTTGAERDCTTFLSEGKAK